jgi:hypothetical protein
MTDYDAVAEFKRQLSYPWELSEHNMMDHDEGPSCFFIMGRSGKRKGDTTSITRVITYTYPGDKASDLKIEHFRKIAQKIVDDHNAALVKP